MNPATKLHMGPRVVLEPEEVPAAPAGLPLKRRAARALLLGTLLVALLAPMLPLSPTRRLKLDSNTARLDHGGGKWHPNSSWASEPEATTESLPPESGPPAEYEAMRRRLREHTLELWRYLSRELRDGLAPERAPAVLHQIAERRRLLLLGQERLSEVDGHEGWRRREAERVAGLVWRRLHALQHPLDCRAARKVVSYLGNECGFGCQLHRLVANLQFAYATRRTLVLQSEGWRNGSWEHYFRPLSENCTSLFGDTPHNFTARPDAKVVFYSNNSILEGNPTFKPLLVPRDLAHRMARFSGDPAAWWVGQLVRYVLRPTDRVQRDIDRAVARMNVRAPYVGIHVRRTDKVPGEAQFHPVDEYMARVVEYFATRQLAKRMPRRIYIASDYSHVIKEARRKYPTYVFFGDPAVARTAGKDRTSARALTELLTDLHVLAGSEYFVCTLSSNVGRLVYEMMQSRHVDSPNRIASLDSFYYLWAQTKEHVALTSYIASSEDEISFRKDDILQVTENFWNGFGRATNLRTRGTGKVPLFKTENQLILYSFPEYNEIASN